MKKMLAAVLAAAMILSPAGNIVLQDQSTIVEARGKKSFNSNSSVNNNSTVQNKKADTAVSSKSAGAKSSFMSSRLMKGLMLGGLAGLLFGSLFAGLGMLGSILGFIVNILAIVVLIAVIRKIVLFFKKQNRKNVY